MSPNAATKGNALWKAGTEKEISMDTSKALTKEEGTGATTGRKPNGMISDHSDIEHHLHYFMIWKDTEKRRNVLSQIESWSLKEIRFLFSIQKEEELFSLNRICKSKTAKKYSITYGVLVSG